MRGLWFATAITGLDPLRAWPVRPRLLRMNRKVVIRRAGGLDGIERVEEAEPVPGPCEAKVRTLAAGAAYGDVLLRRGLAGGRFPVTPGYDLVGMVEALGPGASRFQVGDQVAALPGTGGQQGCICLAEG